MPQARPSDDGPRSTRKVQPVQSSRASFLWLFSSVAMVVETAVAVVLACVTYTVALATARRGRRRAAGGLSGDGGQKAVGAAATTRRRGSSSQGVASARAGRSLDVARAAGLGYARRVDSTAQARAKSMPAGRALAIDRRAAAQATRARCRKSIIATWSVVALFEAPSAPRRPPPRRAARIDMCVGRSAPRVVSPAFMALLSTQKRAKAKHKRGS